MEPHHVSFHRNAMEKKVKEKSDTSESEPPAEDLVKKLQGRGSSARKYVSRNDEGALNPKGRAPSDKVPLKSRRRSLRIATWNVRTLLQKGKLDNLCQEAEHLNADIIGVSETRWKEDGYVRKDNYTFIYSGDEENKHGVGFLIKNNILKHLQGYLPVNERCMLLKIKAKPMNISILQVYAPTTEYSDEEIEEFYEDINKTLKNVKSDEVLIVMGDFNAKVGGEKHTSVTGRHGLGERNERGTRLIHFCEQHNLSIMNTYFDLPARQKYTWKSPGDVTRNQIDYILIRRRFRNSIRKCKTYPGTDVNSDHNPVVANVNIKLKSCKMLKKEDSNYDADCLKIESTREKYNVEVRNKYETLMNIGLEQHRRETPNEKTDVKWECLKESVKHGIKVLPKKEKRKNQNWMTDDILKLMEERKKAKGKNKDEYNKLHNEIKKMCTIAKEEWLSTKCQEIEKSNNRNDNQMYKDIKEMTNNKTRTDRSGCIKSKDGKLLFEKEDVKNRWKEYIGDLFDDVRTSKPSPRNLDGPEILKAEVERAIRHIKRGKAPGDDAITAEMIQALDDFGVTKLTELFNEMYSRGYLPSDLLNSTYITIPKKPKARECSDFRTISLMSHTLKIFLNVILERIKCKLNSEIGKEQFGFRPNSGTRDAILCYNIIAQKELEVHRDIYVCFIDYAKAFDRVKHTEVIAALEKAGIDGKDIRIIIELYWNQKAAIRVNQELSDPAEIKRGVRQGCVLSPYLFNIYTEFIFRESNEMPGIKINGTNINNIRYADDTALLASTNEDLQKIVDKVKKESDQQALNMNVSKTKTMVISREEGKTAQIKVEGMLLEQVEHFKYLGQVVTQEGRNEKEVKIRIAQAKSTFIRMKSILTSKDITFPLRIRLVKCYIYPIILYGSETWTLLKESEKKIEAFEMWMFRTMAKISWKEKIKNEEVLKRLGVQRELTRTMKIKKLIYFGHTIRHDCLPRTVLTGIQEGRRRRGRPRRTWVNDIKDWTGRRLSECLHLAQDRRTWRSVARRPFMDDT